MEKIPSWIERLLLPKARIPVMEKMAEFEVRLAKLEKKLSVHAKI